MAVAKIDGEYFLFNEISKIKIPINLDNKMYCVKDNVLYYTDGNELKSYPDKGYPICKKYDEPIKKLMFANQYIVLIFDDFVVYDKSNYLSKITCEYISNVTKVLYIGNNNEFIYMIGNSIYEIKNVTKKAYTNKWEELETFHILQNYGIANAISNGYCIKFITFDGTVYIHQNDKITINGTAKRKGTHYIYESIFGTYIFCPEFRHVIVDNLYRESKIKKN